MEEMQAIMNVIVNNGMAVAITAYFLYRDYKFNIQQVTLLNRLNDLLDRMERKES